MTPDTKETHIEFVCALVERGDEPAGVMVRSSQTGVKAHQLLLMAQAFAEASVQRAEICGCEACTHNLPEMCSIRDRMSDVLGIATQLSNSANAGSLN